MLALKKFLIGIVLAGQLLPFAVIGLGAIAVLGTPLIAAAQQTQGECEQQGGQWFDATQDELGNVTAERCQSAGANVTAGIDKNPPSKGGTCSVGLSFSFDACMKALMSWLGSWFLTMGGALLRLAGSLFDTFILYIVIAFGKTLADMGALAAIEVGWTVFRDFSNILIIGFFVFIAISIILGLSEFGQKRLIANVLVVAVLMNFSLLFTKLIIDGSNFVAYQVYAQMARSNGSTSNDFDVSQSFLSPMKITSVWDTYGLVREVADTSNSGMQAFVYGLVGGIMLTAVAIVLFYGAFLIAWRGILFILLMLTAPLAFASYLIPNLSKGPYGWDSWWKMLINNAAFGPLLMIMLALSLAIVNAAGSRTTTPIGDIITDPSKVDPGAWATILVYIIGIGLLFASLRLASNFAGSIGGGFKFASIIPALGLAASARFAAVTGRNSLGRVGAYAGDKMQKASQNTSRSGLSRSLFDFGAQKAKSLSKKDFNLMRTGVGGVIAGSAGLKADALAGAKVGGFAGKLEKIAERAADKATRVSESNKDTDKRNANTVSREREGNAQLAAEYRQATAVHDNAKKDLELEQGQYENMAARHDQRMRQLEKDLQKEKDNLANNRGTQSAVDAAEQRVANARAAQASAIDQQTERIKRAEKVIEHSSAYVGRVDDRALELAKSKGRIAEYADPKKYAAEMSRNRFTSALYTEHENNRLAHLAEEAVGTKQKKKDLDKSGILDALKNHANTNNTPQGGTHP